MQTPSPFLTDRIPAMQYYFAPLEGVTGHVYRKIHHRYFGGADKYYMPFVSPNQTRTFNTKEWRNIAPDHNYGVPAVPQLLTHNAADCCWALEQLTDLGYNEVNLNLGCPSGTVTRKKKGAGFLQYPDELDAFLDDVFSTAQVPLSIKTRLGYRSADEFPRLLEIFNRYPLAQLIIHPRIRSDFYKNTVKLGSFSYALQNSRCPVCYNGDLLSPLDCLRTTEQFPGLSAIMVGRGLITDPALFLRLQGGTPPDKAILKRFHDDIYYGYWQDFGNERNAVQRMKEFWSYHIHLYQDNGTYEKQLRKTKTPAEYKQLVVRLFQDLELQSPNQTPN